MSHAIVRVKVADPKLFWEVFRSRGRVLREKYGSRGVRVFHLAEDPNTILLEFDWERADIERFLADPEVPPTMKSGSAIGAPEFTFAEPIGELAA